MSLTDTTKRFPLGSLYATPGVMALDQNGGDDGPPLMLLIQRHQSGDWGELCEEDRKANEDALSSGARILSAYTLNGTKVWIITEADRASTTILLPEEY